MQRKTIALTHRIDRVTVNLASLYDAVSAFSENELTVASSVKYTEAMRGSLGFKTRLSIELIKHIIHTNPGRDEFYIGEIGPGEGLLIRNIREYFDREYPGKKLTFQAYEYSGDMIAAFNSNNPAEELIVGDFSVADTPEKKMDLVIAFVVLHEIYSGHARSDSMNPEEIQRNGLRAIDQAYTRIAKMLRPNGYVILKDSYLPAPVSVEGNSKSRIKFTVRNADMIPVKIDDEKAISMSKVEIIQNIYKQFGEFYPMEMQWVKNEKSTTFDMPAFSFVELMMQLCAYCLWGKERYEGEESKQIHYFRYIEDTVKEFERLGLRLQDARLANLKSIRFEPRQLLEQYFTIDGISTVEMDAGDGFCPIDINMPITYSLNNHNLQGSWLDAYSYTLVLQKDEL